MNLHDSTAALIEQYWPEGETADTPEDEAYDSGFKDAVESMCLALQADGVPTKLIHRLIVTVADAHCNNAC